ncbi:glycoside hydrolase [Testicularia cyperi]|uniref:non-reducing end alpha-L-arabinofuranosidase n=1 Tax=Testicularia cyperi TaxID=1882483 RepID=A0A317XM49_9BASI|nr:glycoside hydrolase [Testicularia cyperi]
MKLPFVLLALAISTNALRLPVIRRDTGSTNDIPTLPSNPNEKGPGPEKRLETSPGTGRGDGAEEMYAADRDKLDIELINKPGGKCLFDMNTFVETNLNYDSDGGLYAELIRNRAFQDGDDSVFQQGKSDAIGSGSLSGWQPTGSAQLSLVQTNPLSAALPTSAKVVCPADAIKNPSGTATFGIKNFGFFGLPVQAGWTYTASFYIRSDKVKKFNLKIGLYNANQDVCYDEKVEYVPVTDKWQQVSVKLTSKQNSPNINNVFAVTADCADSNEFQINLVSVMPPTYEGTVVRQDLAKKMEAFAPRAIRWPGGNDLLGPTIASRFQWNNTLGALTDRPGRLGNWHGWNTDGLGVVEMYNFITKLGAKLIVGLWAGVDANGNSVPLDQLDPYVQQQVDFVHFLLDTDGKFADMRVKNGGPKQPYPVSAFMIGNEGQVYNDKTVPYQTRFDKIVGALKKDFASHAGFDEIDLIASAAITVPTGWKYSVDLLNEPLYGTPQTFVDRYHVYDKAGGNNTVYYSMEMAVINSGMEPNDNIWFGPGRLHHSILQGSLAETVALLGMENNCDIVRGAAYAPELQNDSDERAHQSTPGLLEFDTEKVVSSTSWLMQRLISSYRIEQKLPLDTHDADVHNSVYTSAGLSASGDLVVKFVNYKGKAETVSLNTDWDPVGIDCVKVAGGPLDSNTLEKELVQIKACTGAKVSAGTATVPLDPWSFTVVSLNLKSKVAPATKASKP